MPRGRKNETMLRIEGGRASGRSFNITLEKYVNEIRLQIQEYIERNQSNPSYLKINKRAQQLLMYCAAMYQVTDYRISRESTFMGLKICPTDDIDLEQIEVF